MRETDRLDHDLRARLAAERLLAQKQADLAEANSRIAAKARLLSEEITETRQTVELIRSEADALKGENIQVRSSLEQAQSAVTIAERRLWDSIETIPDGFAVFDTQDRLIAANRAYLAPFAELDCVHVGISYRDLLRLAAEEGLVDIGSHDREGWIAMMQGRWLEAAAEPIVIRFWNDMYVRLIDRRTRDGDMVTLALNISETIRRERALKDARQRAEAASRAKSAFLANMSHEIRTPMNGVLAMADLLAEGELDEEQRLCLDTIRKSGEALLVIINDVLDYSKIEADKLELHPAPFDLEETIQEVMTLLQPSAREKNVELILDYDLFMPTAFVGDRGRIRQILTNLVGNALKFTHEGHVLVRVTGIPGPKGAPCAVHLVVEDTGIGIAPEMQEHIFGEFNQAEADRNRSFDGTGLGLAITRRLVSMMGGEIWLQSELGKGSVFGVRVELTQYGPSGLEAPARPDWIGRIVVLDPDPARRALLGRQIAALGYSPELPDEPSAFETGELGRNDLLFVAHALAAVAADGTAATFVLRSGPGREASPDDGAAVRTLARPFLRRHLMDCMAALEPPEPQEATPEGRAMRVLAAEDNATNRLVLTKLLKSLDIELEIVGNGREALESFKRARPDMILTDISMPTMDGKEATRAIRAEEARNGDEPIPIVAMTAHGLSGDRAEILAAGISHYLAKPLKKADLIEHIVAAAPPGVRHPLGEGR